MTTSTDRIIEISKKLGLSHVGSSLTALPIIEEIFRVKAPDEKFVLSNGHAGLALAVTMYGDKAENIIRENIHADRRWCDCSTGSLGHGIGIALGMALADNAKTVYVMVSDGEMSEGSCWEALRIAKERNVSNLKIYCNANGFASYQSVDLDYLENRIKAFGFPVEFRRTQNPVGFEGLKGHYAKV
jgi:transketolase